MFVTTLGMDNFDHTKTNARFQLPQTSYLRACGTSCHTHYTALLCSYLAFNPVQLRTSNTHTLLLALQSAGLVSQEIRSGPIPIQADRIR